MNRSLRDDDTPHFNLDALDDADHVEAALRCFTPLIRGGVQWRRRVSPQLADAHHALSRAAIGLRHMQRAVERAYDR